MRCPVSASTRAEPACTVQNIGPGPDVPSLALDRRGDVVEIGVAERDDAGARGLGAGTIPTDFAKSAASRSVAFLREAFALREP